MTNTMPSAPASGDQPALPVLLFLEGATGFRQIDSYQVGHLASHGYVFVALDQPGVAAVVAFSDGRQAAGLTLAQFRPVVRPGYMPGLGNPSMDGLPQPSGKARAEKSIVPYLVRDLAFAPDQLRSVHWRTKRLEPTLGSAAH